jgi:chromosome segregation ATPase
VPRIETRGSTRVHYRNGQGDPPRPDLQVDSDELEAARERDGDLAEQLRAAELKIMELKSENATLKSGITELESEVASLRRLNFALKGVIIDLKRAAHPLDEEASRIAERCCKIRAFLGHPEQHREAIYKLVSEILHAVEPETKGAKPVSDLSEKLDLTAYNRGMSLPPAATVPTAT